MPSIVRNLKLIKQKATATDRKEILRLMQDVFYKTDPSSVYSKVAENPSISSIIQDMTMESLDEDLSYVTKAKETDKTILGVAINGIRPAVVKPNYMESVVKKVKSKSERTLLELWRFVSAMPPDSDKYFEGERNVFEIRYLVVDPAFRNRGIATSLVNASIKEAAAKEYKFVRVDCTSHFTARIASAAGMNCIYGINYKDYRDPSGEHVFQNVVFPHTKVLVYAGKSFV